MRGKKNFLEYILFSVFNTKSDVAKHESDEAPWGQRLDSMI